MAVWSKTSLSEITENFGRLDAEFFRPEYLANDHLLERIPNTSLRLIAKKIDVGHVGSMVKHYSKDSKDGVLLLQTQNVKEFFLDLSHSVTITSEFHAKLKKSQVQAGNILIARSGSFGSASIYLEDKVINSADIIIVDVNEESEINSFFLVAFMNSVYGSTQLVRFASGGVQGHVNLKILEHFKIPKLDIRAQEEVADSVKTAYLTLKSSEVAYKKAQQLLESEMGLDKLRFDKAVGYTAQFSELEMSRRADPEYFNPVAANIVAQITEFEHIKLGSCFSVGNGFPWHSKKFLNNNSGEPVVRIRNTRPNHIDIDELTSIDPYYAQKIGFPKANKGEIVVGMDGIKYFYASLLQGDCYVNQRVAHLKQLSNAKISSEYVAFIINSCVGQAQLLRDMTIATTVGHITNRNIAKLVIPYVSDDFHDNITLLIRDSIDKKQESKQLLNQAKSRVEQLIEKAVQE
ncbi:MULTISPECIES: restriction endonuclease subunit S [Cyanophyceae]|uniref:restriction endonuclease subunit S n=1 Tax=Cyanophyceae TaxID=3028117 RepID=UPI00168213A4|nr:restriction endonuclease subunit S [Trichocoleus sp. FACHB-40]MBD2003609.1 restriction endonuclease subunit S [Trichocoleus sp. FACHB-40]